jgi:hypothetical protein
MLIGGPPWANSEPSASGRIPAPTTADRKFKLRFPWAASTPIDFETTEVTHSYSIRKLGDDDASLAKTQRVGDALIRDLVKQVEEDLVILDRKICQPQPQLSEADGPIVQFRKWAKQFYLEGDPRAVNR